jgi:hypothetical protein
MTTQELNDLAVSVNKLRDTDAPKNPAVTNRLWRRIPTVVKVIAAGALAFFILGFSLPLQPDHPDVGRWFMGIFTAVGGAILTAWICVIAINGMKGKPWFVVWGVISLFVIATPGMVPAFWMIVLPIVGASRIAKPKSSWAKKYYQGDKAHMMEIATQRFSK